MSDTQGIADVTPYVPPAASAPRNSVCSDWATADDVTLCGDKYADIDSYVLADALTDASNLLWRKSGKRWPGLCTDTVRPPCGTLWSGYNAPMWEGGGFHDGTYVTWGWGGRSFAGCCGCNAPPSRCCCDGPSQITLGRTIATIVEVLIDGEVLDPSGYRVDDWQWLVRLPDADGTRRSWPCSNDLSLPTSEEGTWAVTFSFGALPPPEGVRAAARLAGELALDRCGQACDLPDGLTRASREGLDFAVLTPGSDVWEGMPTSVTAFLDAANPKGISRTAAVFSVDLPRQPIRTDT